ncbi:MAG: MFS transporter [Anaerolineae bacterium]|nr:MFS transporter [Anaerolineae bacterium]
MDEYLQETDPLLWRYWRRRIFLICWVTYALYYLGRVNLAVAIPEIRTQFHWSKASVGLIGSAFYWVYAIAQFINGQLGDLFSARKFIAIGLALSGLLNLLFGWQGTLWAMILLWGLNGWPQATGWGPMIKTLSRWFPPEQKGKITALFAPCYVAGNTLAWALGGWLIASAGWRFAFWIPGGILLLWTAIWYWGVRDSPEQIFRGETRQRHDRRSRLRLQQALLTLLRTPLFRWGAGTCFLSGMIKDGLTLWGPTYLIEKQGMDVTMAAAVAVIIPIAGALGAVTAGGLVHRLRGREWPVVGGLALLIVFSVLGLYWTGLLGWKRVALLMLTGAAFGSHGMNALLMTSLPLSLGPRGAVSSAAGTFDFASYVGGGLSVALVGALQDWQGWNAVYGWWSLVAFGIGLLALGERKREKTSK